MGCTGGWSFKQTLEQLLHISNQHGPQLLPFNYRVPSMVHTRSQKKNSELRDPHPGPTAPNRPP